MSQTDEIRELLREAGAWMLADAKTNPGYAEKVLELHGRITSMLTEPKEPCQTCAISKAFHDVAVNQRDGNAYLLGEMTRERDEARDEVERLNKLLTDSTVIIRETVAILASVVRQVNGGKP